MSLLEDIQVTQQQPYVRCPIAIISMKEPELGIELAAAVDAVDENGLFSVTGESIAIYMTELGHPLKGAAVRNHRRRTCACPA